MVCLLQSGLYFVVYHGKKEASSILIPIIRKDPKLAHKVVMELSKDIKGKWHVIAIKNFLSNIGLFKDLASRGIYALWTMRSKCIGISIALKDTKAINKMFLDILQWRMHEVRPISSALWKNKKLVFLVSTTSTPIGFLVMPVDTVPWQNGTVLVDIST